MKRYILTSILLFAATASSMTLENSVEAALKSNSSIMAQKSAADSVKFQAETQRSGYYPKAEAGYAYKNSSEKAFGFVEEQFSQIGLELTYNLFSGGADKYGYLSAEKLYEAEKFTLTALENDTVLAVKKAYIEILKAKENIAVADKAKTLLENQMKDVTLAYSVGYAAKNEMLKVEAELANAHQAQLLAVSNYKTSVFVLEQLVGNSIAEDEKFEPVSLKDKIDPYAALKEDMLKNRSEIKYMHSLIESAGYSEKAVRAGYLPKINIGAGIYSYGQDISPTDRKYTYDTESLLSASVSINLFDGYSKKNAVTAKQTTRNSLIHQLNELKSKLELQLKTALENFKLAKASFAAAEKETASAEENYRITNERFKQKVATNTDLLDARAMLTRAESGKNSARYNIYKAVAEIERITEKQGL